MRPSILTMPAIYLNPKKDTLQKVAKLAVLGRLLWERGSQIRFLIKRNSEGHHRVTNRLEYLLIILLILLSRS
jgi:hypothetical protein